MIDWLLSRTSKEVTFPNKLDLIPASPKHELWAKKLIVELEVHQMVVLPWQDIGKDWDPKNWNHHHPSNVINNIQNKIFVPVARHLFAVTGLAKVVFSIEVNWKGLIAIIRVNYRKPLLETWRFILQLTFSCFAVFGLFSLLFIINTFFVDLIVY